MTSSTESPVDALGVPIYHYQQLFHGAPQSLLFSNVQL